MASVTIKYDPEKITLIGGTVQADGTRMITDYLRHPDLSSEIAAAFELPDQQKINIVASCTPDGSGRCQSQINGEAVLLATLPVKIRENAAGETNLVIQHAGCQNQESQSLVIEDNGPAESNDVLATVSSASYLIASAASPRPVLGQKALARRLWHRRRPLPPKPRPSSNHPAANRLSTANS